METWVIALIALWIISSMVIIFLGNWIIKRRRVRQDGKGEHLSVLETSEFVGVQVTGPVTGQADQLVSYDAAGTSDLSITQPIPDSYEPNNHESSPEPNEGRVDTGADMASNGQELATGHSSTRSSGRVYRLLDRDPEHIPADGTPQRVFDFRSVQSPSHSSGSFSSVKGSESTTVTSIGSESLMQQSIMSSESSRLSAVQPMGPETIARHLAAGSSAALSFPDEVTAAISAKVPDLSCS